MWFCNIALFYDATLWAGPKIALGFVVQSVFYFLAVLFSVLVVLGFISFALCRIFRHLSSPTAFTSFHD